jgi:hypothetical protein
MRNILIVTLLMVLSACTKNPTPNVVDRQLSVVSSGSGDFGVVEYGKNPIKSFVFKNTGAESVSGLAVLTGSGFEIALQLGCENLAPGKNCLVKVIFNSLNKESGDYNSILQVGDATVNLSARIESIPSTVYSFSVDNQLIEPEGLQLGPLTGKNIKLMTVKVKNVSPKTGKISSLSLSNDKFRIIGNGCANIKLKPSQSCIAKVVVQGDNTNDPNFATELTFDEQSRPATLPKVQQVLSGQMIALNDSITLGEFFEEGTNKIQLLKIENQGNGVGSVDSSAIVLPPGYTLGTNNCLNVKPGSSCVIRLVYSSTDLAKGSHTDTITIGDSDVDLTVNQVTNPNDLQSLNLTVTENIPVGACAPVTIALKDSEDLDYVSAQPIAINTSSTLYSDSNCTLVDNLAILPFESGKNLFIKNSLAGPRGLLVSIKNKTEEKPLYFYNPLTLSTNKANIVVGQQAQITVNGGRGPFSVETLSGGGTLTIGGVYTSDSVGVANFKVTDTVLGHSATVSVNVVDVLSANLISFEKVVNQTQALQGQKGLDPYVYSKVSGVGSIDAATGLYSADSMAGVVQLKITDALSQEVLVNGQVYSAMQVSPLSKSIVSTSSHQILPSGGKLPYAFSKLSGDGSVNSVTGIYSSPGATSAQIKVTDALGQEQLVTIQVVLPLSANIVSFEKIVNQTQLVQGQNGLPPYAFSKISGVGSIDASTGVYSSGNISGAVQLKVTDALNQEVVVNGQVYGLLNISPLNSNIVLSQSQIFSATGGKPPYVFAKVSGVGEVNSQTGSFSSLTVGSAQIKVIDALGQESTTNVTVNSNITLTSGTCSTSIPEQVDCQVNSSGGVGSRTYSVDKGFINSTTGVFYGQCESNLGQSTVTVTDSMGNSANLSLSYPCVHKTCSQLRAQGKGLVSANYWLDPDGIFKGGTTSPFNVYCDFRANGTFALMAEKKAADGFYFPASTVHQGQILGFYNLNPSVNGSFSIDLKNYASIPSAVIRLEDGLYNYVMSWDGQSNFKYVSSANLPNNPPGKIWTLNSTGFQAPAVGTSLLYASRPLGSLIEDQCGMSERNGTNPHAGISEFYFLSLNPASGWSPVGSQNWCPYGLGAHGDYQYNGISWLGGNITAAGTAMKVYYQDAYFHHPISCADALQKGILNDGGQSGSGVYTIDPDGYLLGSAPYQVICDMTARTESTLIASGGSTQDYTVNGVSYRSHTFPTGTSSLVISQATAAANIDALIVAGGGGGGSSGAPYAGGGGAGGMIVTSVTPSAGTYSMVVGAGGPAQNNGLNSSAFGQIAIGGGAGASAVGGTGGSGGSGGGGAHSNGAPGNGTLNQGYAGGWASNNGTHADTGSGGGGGAGGRGSDLNSGQARNSGGQGGPGLENSFRTGSPLWYAAGGCGAGRYYCTPTNGIGGASFGFIPAPPYTTPGPQPLTAGAAGTGSGGGGGRGTAGAAGGSGTIVIRYKLKTF